MCLYQISSNNSPGVKFDPTPGVTSFTRDYIGKTLEIALYLAIWPSLLNLACSFIYWASTKSAQGIALGSNLALPRGSQVLHCLYREKLKILLASSNKAYQIMHVAISTKRAKKIALGPNLALPWGEGGVTTFTWNHTGKTLEISLCLAIKPRLAKFCM